MTIIFDTNVIISAFVFRGVAQKCFDTLVEFDELVVSNELIKEIRAKFQGGRVKKLLKNQYNEFEVENYLEEFFAITKLVGTHSNYQICRDPKDNMILNLAKDSNCDIVVTGDKDLLVLNPFTSIKIISPADFVLFKGRDLGQK